MGRASGEPSEKKVSPHVHDRCFSRVGPTIVVFGIECLKRLQSIPSVLLVAAHTWLLRIPRVATAVSGELRVGVGGVFVRDFKFESIYKIAVPCLKRNQHERLHERLVRFPFCAGGMFFLCPVHRRLRRRTRASSHLAINILAVAHLRDLAGERVFRG